MSSNNTTTNTTTGDSIISSMIFLNNNNNNNNNNSNISSSTTTTATTTTTTSNTNDKMDISMSPPPSSSNSSLHSNNKFNETTAKLYPNVNQKETPLPRQWSTQHKFQTLSLSHSNLRVTYKGPGKTHKDAASVRTDYPIPSTCGIYYFEVKIISKGRDGYMGIGLSKSDVHLNRLPGWDKNSYGYHGDDGHSFCCSGTGQNYGPTFTTGDVIGCCLNLIENTCFYTKNGLNLGIAFRDLPSELHPTVGLQTPSESVEANFGQLPFEFDIQSYVNEWHLKTRATIERFPLKKENEANLPIILRKLISTYLVHHGYSATAEAFAKSVGHVFEEELASIRNRQKIQKAVLNGEIGEAIELTHQLFPGILEKNPNLLFALKIRQFIEMIIEMNNITNNNEQQQQQLNKNIKLNISSRQSSTTDNNIISTINNTNSRSQSPSISRNSNNQNENNFVNNNNNNHNSNSNNCSNTDSTTNTTATTSANNNGCCNINEIDVKIMQDSISSSTILSESTDHSLNSANMDVDGCDSKAHNSNSKFSNQNGNGYASYDHDVMMEDTDVCSSTNENKSSILGGHNDESLEKILRFGRDLFQLSLLPDNKDNVANQKMLKDAFSLLAYHDPISSPVGYQLDSTQREPISAMLNSAILEANNMPRIPPLEVVYGQVSECMKLMSKNGVPWCAYVNLTEYMQS